MPEARVVTSISDIGARSWDALFPGELESYDYLMAVEAAGLEGFRWRYAVVTDDDRLLAAAPVFLTAYALETTLTGAGRWLAGGVRRVLPNALTLKLACLGSPCTETLSVGYALDLSITERALVLRRLLATFEAEARREGCGLMGVKDVPGPERVFWDVVAGPVGYQPIPGLPVAHLDIDFPDLQTYLGRLSGSVRKDMRRKLRSLEHVRIEVREDLDGVLDRVMDLYHQTRERAEMQFEDLTPAYFAGVTKQMPGRAFYVLYYAGDELLAANLLLQDGATLLDKFFCMDAARGRLFSLYFLSWFTNISLCLERGLRRYQSGQAAYENKLRLGSRLTPTSMYFRHRNPVVNRALQLLAPLLSADLAEARAP